MAKLWLSFSDYFVWVILFEKHLLTILDDSPWFFQALCSISSYMPQKIDENRPWTGALRGFDSERPVATWNAQGSVREVQLGLQKVCDKVLDIFSTPSGMPWMWMLFLQEHASRSVSFACRWSLSSKEWGSSSLALVLHFSHQLMSALPARLGPLYPLSWWQCFLASG